MKATILAGLLALALTSCASPRNDGMGNLWVGVREVMKQGQFEKAKPGT